MSDEHMILRQISLPMTRENRNKRHRRPPIGIVPEIRGDRVLTPALAPIGFDKTFPPTITPPVSVEYDGGKLGQVETVQLIFWGSAWNQSSTIPSAVAIAAAVQTILKGPYMSGLRQYGIKRCSFGEAVVATSPDVPSTFDDSDVQDLILLLIDTGHFPSQSDHQDLFFVFMPPGTIYGPGGARGAHSVADDAWVAWIGNNTLNQITSTFCHELAEMCSDPEGDGWTVVGQPSPVNEIGDICNLLDAPLGGVNVESYWSPFDNACLIPSAWSLRRTLAGAGRTLKGQGLRSVQDPIPSVNQFIVDL